MEGIIYKFTNTLNNKSYIGQTINEKGRERCFFNKNKNYCKPNSKIDNARRKYGLSKNIWKKEVLARVICEDKEKMSNELNKMEKYYIAKYDTQNNGYNSTDGGQSGFTSSYVLSDELKEKCKVWKNKHMHNYVCDMIRKKKNGNKHSEETKNKIKESVLKNYITNKKFNRAIYQCDKNNHDIILKEYSSINSVKEDGFNPKNVSQCLYGINKSCGGYFWKYKEEERNLEIKGCYFLKNRNRWKSKLRYHKKEYVLGLFMTEKEASAMYQYAKDFINNGGDFIEWFKNIEKHKKYIRDNFS